MVVNEVEKFVRKNGGGPIHKVYGPSQMAGFAVWEVWVQPEGDFDTRFVAEAEGAEPKYFDSFASLALEIEKVHARNKSAIGDSSSKRLASVMAAMGFLVGLALLGYIVVNGEKQSVQALALVVSLLSSAGSFYYGVWKTPTS